MALSGRSIFVAGYCEVYADTGADRALDNVGVTINGVQFVEQRFHSPVPGDENGGEEGPPVDKQFMGAVDLIQCDLSKVNETAIEVIRERAMASTSSGSIGTPGSLLIAGGFYTRILVVSSGFVRNYPICLLGEPIAFSTGTKYSRTRVAGEAHRNISTGLLWNQTQT